MEARQKEKLYEMLPLFVFAAAYFVAQLFDWMDTAHFLFAVVISFITFASMASLFKTDYQATDKQIRSLNLYSGLLTAVVFIFFLQSFLHWYRMIGMNYRMTALMVVLLIYFVLLFRAMRTLSQFKSSTLRK